MISENGNWHTETMEKYTTLSIDELRFIQRDANEAARIGRGWNPKVSQYLDQVSYAGMELKKRGL